MPIFCWDFRGMWQTMQCINFIFEKKDHIIWNKKAVCLMKTRVTFIKIEKCWCTSTFYWYNLFVLKCGKTCSYTYKILCRGYNLYNMTAILKFAHWFETWTKDVGNKLFISTLIILHIIFYTFWKNLKIRIYKGWLLWISQSER